MKKVITTRTGVLLLILVVMGVYYSAIYSPLNSVDDPGMYNYLLNSDGFSLREIFFPGGLGSYYRPLLLLSYMMDKHVWGLQEGFMHLENVFFHLCNTLMVFAVARRACLLAKIDTPYAPFVAALFFAIHPLNTEAVNWIAGRTDLLAGFFILLATWLLTRKTSKRISSLLAALCLILACLAKETAVFFLPVALVSPYLLPGTGSGKKSPRKTVLKNMPHFLFITAAGCGYFLFRLLAFKRGDSGVSRVLTHVTGEQADGLFAVLRIVFKTAGFYLKKLFVPFPLNFGIIHVSDLYIILGVMLCIAVIWLLARRTIPGFFFISAFSIGAAALMVPLLKLTWTPLAERYMYIPSAFFLVGLTIAAYQRVNRHVSAKIVIPAIAALAAIALVGTVQRNLLWQDNLALFEDTLRKSPDFTPAKNEIANALFARGRIDEAYKVIKSMETPHDLSNFQYGLISKSAALANQGDLDGARRLLRQVLANPGKSEPEALKRLLKLNDSEVFAGKAPPAKFYPDNVQLLTRLHAITGDPFYLYRLGQIHMFQGERMKARDAFQRVVAQTPDKMYYRHTAQKLLEKLPAN